MRVGIGTKLGTQEPKPIGSDNWAVHPSVGCSELDGSSADGGFDSLPGSEEPTDH